MISTDICYVHVLNITNKYLVIKHINKLKKRTTSLYIHFIIVEREGHYEMYKNNNLYICIIKTGIQIYGKLHLYSYI